MDPMCRFCIAIPCYYGEWKIQNTLEKYKKLIKEWNPKFEITLLLNWPSDQQIDESDAKRQIMEFMKTNPGFPLQVFSVTIPFQVKWKIWRLRWILTKINADRCIEAWVSINNFFHITHDADLVDIDPSYLVAVERYFSNNPNTQIVGWHVEYPEWFKWKYYLWYILQRVEDAFCIVGWYRNKTSVKSWNAIYRLDNLLSHPFKDAKKGEASNVVNATRKKFWDLWIWIKWIVAHANRHMIPPIVSDPRRIVLSIEWNESANFSRRHERFAQEGDLMFQYSQTLSDQSTISDGILYDNAITKEQIAIGIQWLLIGRLTHIYRSAMLTEDQKQVYIHRMRNDIKKAVFLSIGVTIEIDNNNIVIITHMERLQESLL